MLRHLNLNILLLKIVKIISNWSLIDVCVKWQKACFENIPRFNIFFKQNLYSCFLKLGEKQITILYFSLKFRNSYDNVFDLLFILKKIPGYELDSITKILETYLKLVLVF